ncbi:MAG: PAS domain-containing protein [Acidimicrobiia bacterium]
MSANNGSGSIQSLAAIVESAADGIVTADEAGMIVSWNPASERMFGWKGQEVIGKSLSIIVPERFRASHEEGMARVATSGETRIIGKTVEVFGQHRSGSKFPIELSLATWIDDGRRYFSGIIRDVTVRTELTEKLSRSEQRLQAIVKSANDAIVSIDEKGIVTMWNPAAEALFGYRLADGFGRSDETDSNKNGLLNPVS